jgi:large subunit ribosomal protein L35
MPKMKTKRAARKRFKTTGTGKLIRRRGKKRHMLEHKTSKHKRHLGKPALISPADQDRIKALVPYL